MPYSYRRNQFIDISLLVLWLLVSLKRLYKRLYLLLFGSNIEIEIQITNEKMISGINLFTVLDPFEYWAYTKKETKKNKKNLIGINLAEAKLLKKEQDIFYKAIEIYFKKYSKNYSNWRIITLFVKTGLFICRRGLF